MLGQRLKQLRLARGFSLESLAGEMGGIVTKQALSKYELGKAQPSQAVMNRLASALGVKAARLWREPEIRVKFIAYRKGSGLPKTEQARVENLVIQTLEDRVQLQELTQKFDGRNLPVKEFAVATAQDAENAAIELRRKWNLGLDPIASVTGVLEDHLIHIIEIEANDKFDGNAAVAYSADDQKVVAAAVVSRKGVPGDRQRLNLTHELGHLCLDVAENADEEALAFRFGAAFLAPAEVVRGEVGSKRASIQPGELLLLKQRFGMSAQALLYRLRDLEIVTESYYRQWWMHISRMGWRKEEPLGIPPERPQWLSQITLHAYAEGLITRDQAESLLGEEVEANEPSPFINRRAFMRLPLEERRRILAEQAEKLVAHYDEEAEKLKDLQAGDWIEY